MPLFTEACISPDCVLDGDSTDEYYKHWNDPQRPCVACGGPTKRFPSQFSSPFMGEMSRRYVDTSLDDGHRKDLSHWVFEKGPDGKVKPSLISTFQEQREYCKRNGLANPSDLDSNCEVSEYGRRFQKATATLQDLKELEKKTVAQPANPA